MVIRAEITQTLISWLTQALLLYGCNTGIRQDVTPPHTPDLASSKQQHSRFLLHGLYLMRFLNSSRKISLATFPDPFFFKCYFVILAGEQIDRWKHGKAWS